VVQALVQEEIFVQEAEKLGLRVSDMELAQTIQSFPAFQRDGRFDIGVYQTFLNRLRLKVEEFEETQRRQILGQKAQMLMASGVRISSLEAPQAFQEALAQSSPEDRKKFMENPEELREQVRRREIQASLQEWYTVLSTQIKVKVLLNQIEGEPGPEKSS
jgi:peptidyl-prolyl cis-trans isomerase D